MQKYASNMADESPSTIVIWQMKVHLILWSSENEGLNTGTLELAI